MFNHPTETEFEQDATLFFMSTGAAAMHVTGVNPPDSPYRLRTDPADHEKLILKRADWNKVTPFRVETDRLIIRPIADSDLDDFHRIAGQESVARMLVNLDHPLSRDAAGEWLRKRQFRGRLGFMVGIYGRDDRLLGSIGLGGISTALVYFLSEECRGQGIGTEAVRSFLAYAKARFALQHIFAGVFTDNPASRHLLEKEGFQVTGEKPFQSPARTEAEMIWEMNWGISSPNQS